MCLAYSARRPIASYPSASARPLSGCGPLTAARRARARAVSSSCDVLERGRPATVRGGASTNPFSLCGPDRRLRHVRPPQRFRSAVSRRRSAPGAPRSKARARAPGRPEPSPSAGETDASNLLMAGADQRRRPTDRNRLVCPQPCESARLEPSGPQPKFRMRPPPR